MLVDKTGDNDGGEILRHVYAGGHTLYWRPETEVIEKIQQPGPLLVFHLEHTDADESSNLIAAILLYSFIGFMVSITLMFMLRIGAEGLWFFLLVILIVCVIGVAWDRGKNPFNRWKSEKHIDYTTRELIESSSAYNRNTKAEEVTRKVTALDELVLVCYVNRRWEDGSSIDLSLAFPVKTKNVQYYPLELYICHLYSSPVDDTDETKAIVVMPADVKRVADAFIEKTRIRFVDMLSKQGFNMKQRMSMKQRRATISFDE